MDAAVSSTDHTLTAATAEGHSAADPSVGTVGSIEASLDALCREYERRPVADLVASCQTLLDRIEQQVDADRLAPSDRQQVLAASGWVWALLGCANFDAGRRRYAESCRDAVRDIAEQTAQDELAGWTWEMLTRFALADQKYGAARAAAQAGQTVAAPGAPVVARLALHEAKAAARLRDCRTCMAAIDHAWQIVDGLPRPHDTDHYFGMDETLVHAHTATAYLWLGEYSLAEDLAWHVLTRVLTPDGHTRHPMRVAETRITLAVLAARRGDPEQALYHGMTALATERICAPMLLARARDLVAALAATGPAARRALHEFRAKVAKLQQQVESNKCSHSC